MLYTVVFFWYSQRVMITTPVQTKDEIYQILSANRDRLRHYGVQRLGLFGSFVRHEQTPASDVDLLVNFKPNQKKYSNFIGLTYFLEDAFKRQVEVVTPESLTVHLRPHIEKEVEYVFD